ncbi:MAG: hypothetical protein WED05_10640 [Candidatus Atabeyarchaeum deiterrae]
MSSIDPADENNALIVLDAFGLPVYKLEDELYQHYLLTCDHRRIKPMTKEQLVTFLKRLETIGALASFNREGKTYWKRLISFKDFEKED